MKKIKLLLALIAVAITSTSAFAGNTLSAEQVLQKGQYLASNNGYYSFVMQTDGNLVRYRTVNGTAVALPWGGRMNHGGHYVRMQMDGNLAEYTSSNTWWWTSNTGGRPYNMGYKLVLSEEGGLDIYDANGTSIWNVAPDACNATIPPREWLTCKARSTGNTQSYVVANCQETAKKLAAADGAALGVCPIRVGAQP